MNRLLILYLLLSFINAAAQSNKTTIPTEVSHGTLIEMARHELRLILDCTNPDINGISATINYSEVKTYEEWGETKHLHNWFKFETIARGLSILSYEKTYNDGHYMFERGYSYTFRLYLHSSDGLLKEVRYYRHYYDYNVDENQDMSTVYSLERRELYEYDSNSRLKSITFMNYDDDYYDYKYYLADDFHICQKDYRFEQLRYVYKVIYKYSTDGNYDVYGCTQEGKTLFHNIIYNEKHLVTGKDYADTYYTWSFNDSGQLLAYGTDFFATNGIARFGTYYKYNINGDLVVKSSRSDVITENEPWLLEKYQDGLSKFYKYTYDSRNNWVLQEELGLKNGNMVVVKAIERVIDYKD